MKSTVSWGILLAVAVCLIIVGIQGRLGSLMAAVLTPAALTDSTSGGSSAGDTSGSNSSSGTNGNAPAPTGNGNCPPGYVYYQGQCVQIPA